LISIFPYNPSTFNKTHNKQVKQNKAHGVALKLAGGGGAHAG